jgi:N-methylhydantoinase B
MSPSGRQGEPGVDPVTLSILWNRLLSITEEMGSTLRRTAYSEAVREGDDFSTGLFDRHGRLIAQGNFTPGHTGSMPFVVKSCIDQYPPQDLRPGDAILLNDSFLGSGHFPDFFLVTPVFDDDAIIGYACNTAHHVDVGGYAPGSQEVAGVQDAIQEGLRVLPVRVVREGVFDDDVLRLILGNVRLPDKVRGDFQAQRNANHNGAERLRGLFREYGANLIDSAVEEILDRTEARMRERITALPDGVYEFEDWMDDHGAGSDPIRFHVAVGIDGDTLTLDFSGSSDQVPAGINSYINYTRAYSSFAVKVMANALLPQNDGAIRPIKVESRPGSFFNPQYPAPSGGRAAIQIRIYEVVNGALAQVVPEMAMAGFSHWSNPNISGTDDRTGERFIQYDLVFGGYGGQATKDGEEGLSPVMNCTNIPIEVLESRNPILIRRFEMVADSAGAGKFRGGCAIRKDVEILNSTALVTNLGDRHVHAPYGLFGGRPGRLAETVLNPDGDALQLGSKESRAVVRGDIIRWLLSGAGGYGDPADRDPARIIDDIADGYISEEGARRDYGYEPAAPAADGAAS